MIKKQLFALLTLATFSHFTYADNNIEENLFAWAAAGQAVSFPQTYILKKDNTTQVSQLSFGDKTSYLAALAKRKTSPKNLMPVLKQNFPNVWDNLQQQFKQHDQVLLTVSVSKTIAACDPCTLQKEVLQEKNYLGLPHINLVLTK